MAQFGPARQVSEHQSLTLRHHRELSEMRQKQQDEWLTLLDTHRKERDQLWSKGSQDSVVNGPQLPASRAAQPSHQKDIVDLTLGEDNDTPVLIRSPTYLRSSIGGMKLVDNPKEVGDKEPNESASNSWLRRNSIGSAAVLDAKDDQPSKAESSTYIKTTPRKSQKETVVQCTPSRKNLLKVDAPTELPPSIMRQQMNNRADILKDHKRIPRDPTLIFLQQKQKEGRFVSDVLDNKRSQNWASVLGAVFQSARHNGTKDEMPPIGGKERKSLLMTFKYTVGSKATTQQAMKSPQRVEEDTIMTEAPESRLARSRKSRSPTRPSAPPVYPTPCRATTTPSNKTGAVSSFKTPPKPHSSGVATPDSPKGSRQREESVTSHVSATSFFTARSAVSQQRKRRNVIQLSDESDYDPSEPSPLNSKVNGVGSKSDMTVKNAKGINGYGSKRPRTPPFKSGSGAIPSTPSAPVAKRHKFTPSTPESPSVRAASAMPLKKANAFLSATQRHATLPRSKSSRTGLRVAKSQAEEKIRELAEEDEDFWTKEFVRKIDDEEKKMKAIWNDYQMKRVEVPMRSMSITRATASRRGHESDHGNDSNDSRVHGTEDLEPDRMTGDSCLAKAIEKDDDTDSGHDLDKDLSQYKWVNGVIIPIGDEDQEMDVV
ncbi:hypothetical protein K505DRAFT_342654 [Melanomma pulvis-pyrius CBS 109.77]|uniref:Uncharacterized protein n=1 Tax=Melanomma pulvis-pyrius CBS 109.77 TaxID=1314802 RepID=A0A6A6WV30_9PLEO|nr:hypothetical protein K505DRAFT_342654 [Melanomma pulvis-pyrius CBS 109.77]